MTKIVDHQEPQHEAVYFELAERLADRNLTSCNVGATQRALRDLGNAAEEAAATHETETGGRGRPPQEALREFIWRLADLFEEAGGRPRVWIRHDVGRIDSPFMRWVATINDCLPETSKAETRSLPELIHSVTEARHKRRRADK